MTVLDVNVIALFHTLFLVEITNSERTAHDLYDITQELTVFVCPVVASPGELISQIYVNAVVILLHNS